MNYISIDYPKTYIAKSKIYRYNYIFLMPPWEEIYISDNERYENFEQALAIHNHLERTYKELGYTITVVPTGNIKNRANFIIEHIKQ